MVMMIMTLEEFDTEVLVRKVQVDYINDFYTGLFEMIVGVLTTCHTQYA